MDKRVAQVGFVIAVLVACVGFLFWQYGRSPDEPPAVAAASPSPSPEEPAILYPVTASDAEGPLPALGDSDALAQKVLGRLFGVESFAKLFRIDGMIRRFVATVDNLPRKTVPQNLVPLRPVEGRFTPDAGNHRRYLPYVQLAEAVDAKILVATYQALYPLLQDAYEELGYPDGYFNDRLVVAIDDLLDAPEVAAPELTQPNVLYVFADPALEARSSGQKIMIRMGTENAARVKTRLRAIRTELTQ